jgi:hypothetical protein
MHGAKDLMPGYNHHADCGCGWCVKESGSFGAATSWYAAPKFDAFESYTIPNARCPVCGDSVFFYQSEFGGRVYFDSLGPPWPKHPCTISDRHTVGRCLVRQSLPSEAPQWRVDGWIPLIITKVHPEDPWWVVSAKIAETNEPIRLLVHGEPSIKPGAPASFSGWNDSGVAMLAYLENRRQVMSGSVVAFKYGEHFLTDTARLSVEISRVVVGDK